jgi:hypothetical protein
VAIGALNESPLHAALKRALAPVGARFEVELDGYVVDAVHDGLLIEVQTRNVHALRRKLSDLLGSHRMRLVVPIAGERWIVRRGADGTTLSRRRSPKRADLLDALAALVGIPSLLDHPNLEIEAVVTRDEELREHRPGAAWRKRGWVTVERRLLDVLERHRMRDARDWLRALPSAIDEPFTTADIAGGRASRRPVARRAAYVLREAGVIEATGRVGRAVGYRVAPARDDPT